MSIRTPDGPPRTRALEAERLAAQQREAEHQKEIELRQLILD